MIPIVPLPSSKAASSLNPYLNLPPRPPSGPPHVNARSLSNVDSARPRATEQGHGGVHG
uniref:Uncharacterized protein n=1 Tax=Aegilops tauschii subsp. strangulata TaxID=200361 RepID=A0A453L744_AEGTS